MEPAMKRFSCTQCGKCCNRSPEVALSEAAALADVFVFRLMFRLYWLPRVPGGPLEPGGIPADAAAFYQKKRLLDAYAARKYPATLWRDGKPAAATKYLLISALALDTSPGACGALDGPRCGIYERRPLACRTAPFHYSRAEALAESDLKAFVETPGHACDTGDTAPVVLEAGRIVDAEMALARAKALAQAEDDRPWSAAIVRHMGAGSPATPLPSLDEIEANAPLGATTTSMRIAWQIAAHAGLLGREECRALIASQLATIDRELAAGRCPPDVRETLFGMRAEYQHELDDDRPAAAMIGRSANAPLGGALIPGTG
jgi:Fe-S-cluster containining protein